METPSLGSTINYILPFLDGFDIYTLKRTVKSISSDLDIDYVSPLRLTFLYQNMCLVCEKYNEDCKEVNAIHFSDRFGWVTCPNCFPKVRYSKAKYTALNKIITIKNCDEFLEQRDKIGLLSFFRRSKNKGPESIKIIRPWRANIIIQQRI